MSGPVALGISGAAAALIVKGEFRGSRPRGGDLVVVPVVLVGRPPLRVGKAPWTGPPLVWSSDVMAPFLQVVGVWGPV